MMRKRNAVQNFINTSRQNGGGGDASEIHNNIYELRNSFEQLIDGGNNKISSKFKKENKIDNRVVVVGGGGGNFNGKKSGSPPAATTIAAAASSVKTNNYTNRNTNHHSASHHYTNNKDTSNNRDTTIRTSFNEHISAIKGSRPDIYLTVGRKKVISLAYGDDLSNIDVKRLVSTQRDRKRKKKS